MIFRLSNKAIVFSVCVGSLFLDARLAGATEISVLNCKGDVRAIEQIEGASTVKVEVKAQAGSNLLPAVLTEEAAARKRDGKLEGDRITFSDVRAGQWRVCFANSNLDVHDVSIVTEKDDVTLASIAVAGAGILGGGMALALSEGGSSGSGSGGTSALAGAAGPVAGGGSAPVSSPAIVIEECLTDDAKPEPLSPIE